jgi:hypothetical protein
MEIEEMVHPSPGEISRAINGEKKDFYFKEAASNNSEREMFRPLHNASSVEIVALVSPCSMLNTCR